MTKTAKTTTTTTATTTAQATPTEITAAFQKLSNTDFSVKNANLLLNLKPIKNVDYLTKGLVFFNLKALKARCEDALKKVSEELANCTTETPTSVKTALQAKADLISDRLGNINDRLDKLSLSDEEKESYLSDNYLQLISHSVGWKSNLPTTNMETIMSLLESTRATGILSPAVKKDLKAELDKVCELYKTEDSENYNASMVHFNMHMVNLVHHLYFQSPKLGKAGVYTESWKKERQMASIIMDVLVAKIQGKITSFID